MAHHNLQARKNRADLRFTVERSDLKAWDMEAFKQGLTLAEFVRRTMREKCGTAVAEGDDLGSQARAK